MKVAFPKSYEFEMLEFLAKHYNTEDLARVLVAGTKVTGITHLAAKMLKLLVKDLDPNKTSKKKVFELLQIHLADGDSLKRPLFFIWVYFVNLKYQSQEKAEMKKFTFLKDYFKGDNNLTKVLVAATKIDSTKLLAEQSLNSQIDVWVGEGRDAASVFELLELHQTTGNLFASPLFSTWVEFVRSKFSDDLEAIKTMISTLRGIYADDLTRVLAEGAKIERMKSVAETLQKALNQESPKAPKRKNIDSQPPSQKRQKYFDLNLPSRED